MPSLVHALALTAPLAASVGDLDESRRKTGGHGRPARAVRVTPADSINMRRRPPRLDTPRHSRSLRCLHSGGAASTVNVDSLRFVPGADDVPSSQRPIFVAAATRSGSTLLQRLLNTHPEVTVWGEHMGILKYLRQIDSIAAKFARSFDTGYSQHHALIGELVDSDSFSPHINPFNAAMLSQRVKDLVMELFVSTLPLDTRWGFKEVRYNDIDLTYLTNLFPHSRFIILARSPTDQISSFVRAPWRPKPDLLTREGMGELRGRVDHAAKSWSAKYRSLQKFAECHPESTMIVRYDQLRYRATIDSVFRHIGCKPPAWKQIEPVLDIRTGSSDRALAWSTEDRQLLDEMIADVDFPEFHDDVLAYYFGLTKFRRNGNA